MKILAVSIILVGLLFGAVGEIWAQSDFVFSKMLRRGFSGEGVRQLQELLKNPPAGGLDVYPEGLVTGYFGPLTEAAVKRFQAKHGIESIGIVGPKTRKKLNEFIVAKNTSQVSMPTQTSTPVPSQTPQDASQSSSQSSATLSEDWQYLTFLEKLPNLPVIETWKFEYDTGSGGAFVPDIIEYNGKLYMYAYLPLTGIISFSSLDGKQWTKDAGVRIAEEGKYSHPYAAIAPGGKLYLFVQTGRPETFNMYVSLSESSDGLNFTAPQPILKGEDFNSNHAAHGRIIKLNDEKYLLAVSSGVYGRGPGGSAILYSSDLKTWNFSSVFFAGCHDPTLDVVADGNVYLYCQYLGGKIIRFNSSDGYKWEPQNPAGIVEFLDQNGIAINAGDIDIHTFKDGSKRMFISYNPNPPFGNIWSTIKSD